MNLRLALSRRPEPGSTGCCGRERSGHRKAIVRLVYRFSKTYTFYPCVSVSIRGPKTKLRKLTERQRKQAIWPRMDTDTHGCGVPASSRSTGRRLEQNCMVMFWRNAILDHMGQPRRNIEFDRQLAELQAHAVEVFGDHDAALRWLDTGLSELDNLSNRHSYRRARHGTRT